MRNADSETGYAEDMIRSIVQMSCAEMHLKTLYEKTVAEMENGLADLSDGGMAVVQKANDYLADLETAAGIRRQMMRKLFSMYDGDKDVWCMVKHLGLANMQAWEAWQGSDDDPELLELAMESNKMFVSYITRFLGMEITSCASCLSDFLKGDGKIELHEDGTGVFREDVAGGRPDDGQHSA